MDNEGRDDISYGKNTKMSLLRIWVVVAFLSISHEAKSKVLPDELVGSWEVVEVHINMASGRRVYYGWNEPRMMWRLFYFGDEEIKNNTPEEGTNCAAPTFSRQRVRLDDFLRRNFEYEKGASPSKDYKLGVAGSTDVELIRVLCGQERWNGELGPTHGDTAQDSDGSWLIPMGKKRVMLRWYDQMILVLAKLPPGAKPSPSFACAKATLPTERAICGSLELAGFDKSVGFAYSVALWEARRHSESTVDIRCKQREWLNERNRCGRDTQCIQAEMKKQLKWYESRYD